MIISVYGMPGPQGSKRHVGHGVMVENSKKLKPWREAVVEASRRVMDATPDFIRFEGAVVGRMVFSFDRPLSVKRSKRPFPSISPDLDKLARGVCDALKSAGVWRDDALIVEFTRLAKVYVGEDEEALESPGVYIVLASKVDLIPIGGTPPLGRRAQ